MMHIVSIWCIYLPAYLPTYVVLASKRASSAFCLGSFFSIVYVFRIVCLTPFVVTQDVMYVLS